ncbi:hypothetical protein ACLKA6_017520 [Drosophila palustris]
MAKVDPVTRSKWEESLDYKAIPLWKDCEAALNKRYQHLSAEASTEDATKWPQNAHLTLKEQEKSLEKKKCATALIAVDAEPHPFLQIVQDLSSYLKVIGIVAYALRFINKRKGLSWKSIVPSADEYSAAFLTIVEIIQQESFSDHIGKLRKSLSLHSSYQKLNPFISAEQVGNNKFLLLRVGGRLLHAPTFNIYTKPIVILALVP